jgi:single-strand DNA-binding protein
MFQQITLVGNLGSDPELRYLPSGVPVANFTLAVNKAWTNAQGERQQKTTWFRIAVWRKQAELVAQYLKKGRRVLVVGEVEEANVWTDRDGNPRASLEVTAQLVKFMDRGDDEGEGEGEGEGEAISAPDLEQMPDIPF